MQEIMEAWDRLVMGEQEAHPIIWDHFYPRLIDSIYLNSGRMTEEDVTDVKHDAAYSTLVKICQRPQLVRLNGSTATDNYYQLRAYLVVAAKNQALTIYKQRIRSTDIDAQQLSQGHIERGPEQAVERSEAKSQKEKRRQWLEKMMLEHLSPDQRITLTLRLKGKSYQEIANILGIPVKAAQDRGRRATTKLKALAKLEDELQ
jgi:RNA polymerase sigma factor (sigma-70 family)